MSTLDWIKVVLTLLVTLPIVYIATVILFLM
jgi:hypothetical protein